MEIHLRGIKAYLGGEFSDCVGYLGRVIQKVGPVGLEPTTICLKGKCSTN